MTGYHPNFEFLEKLGIEISDDNRRMPHHNEETYETNVVNLYLAGVVVGGMITNRWFIENARFHQLAIFDDMEQKI